MSTLNEFLDQKRLALQARDEKFAKGEMNAMPLNAVVTAEGRSGIRHIRIRDHHILNDSLYDFAGYDLGPSSPETMMGVLGACVVHICQMQAAARQIPLDSIKVEVNGIYDPRAGRKGYENVPYHPTDITYTVNVESPASSETIKELFEAVEETCPILGLLRHPQNVHAVINHVQTGSGA
nr:OsmC family protein [uncultured Shinella sp.]